VAESLERRAGGAALPWPQDVTLARTVTALPRPAEAGRWLFELKFDGYRGVLHIGAGGCRVQSRRGADISPGFADIAAAAAEQLPAGTVLDGELVIWNAGRLDFPALQRRALASSAPQGLLPASYVVFDALAIGGVDLRSRPLRERRGRLEELLAGVRPPLHLSPATDDVTTAATWLDDHTHAATGIEGLVIKRLDQAYLPGKRAWSKLRIRTSTEAVVGAVIGSLRDPDHLVLGLPDRHGMLLVVGTTSVLSPAQRHVLTPLLRPAAEDHPWPANLPTSRLGFYSAAKQTPVTLVVPEIVVEVSTDTSWDGQRWRHMAALIRTRPDLGPGDLTPPAPA
jgi:ATP-dependent DNA ligase